MSVADIICGGELDAAQLLETTGLPADVRFDHCSWSRHAQVIQRVELPHVKRLHAKSEQTGHCAAGRGESDGATLHVPTQNSNASMMASGFHSAGAATFGCMRTAAGGLCCIADAGNLC
jgi:hypothetical protein